ncbi:universal stress protein [Streptomyces sp. JV185]|uniref:universal stress protein n=1 Tax=Streptomyces sp. JV185 TaxID=858638 RepID=UPI002E7A8D49|nr:universal stress protein [Streptomyces sp. JV185]MEE1768102.1 universal stress protein [Streptomyces sp. JV185]
MRVIVWITEGTWPVGVDAARSHAPDDADIVLLHVTPADVPGAAHGAFAGLLGRGHGERDPGTQLEHLAAASADQLLAQAAQRLGRSCARVEREVVAAAGGADLLVLARDGDRTHLGPRSLGPASRFIVDHAPCPVLLVWPEPAPGIDTIPLPPPHPPHHR